MPVPTYTTDQFPTGGVQPWGICYDENGSIWSCDYNAGNLLKIRESDGVVIGTFPLDSCNQCCYHPGTDTIWVTYASGGSGLDSVAKVDRATGAVLDSFSLGAAPAGTGALCAETTRVWVNCSNHANTKAFLAVDGSLIATVTTGAGPQGICADNAGNVWTANKNNSSVTRITASTQTATGTFTVGVQPYDVAFDGTDLWVTDQGYSPDFFQTLERVSISSGGVIDSYPLGDASVTDNFWGLAWNGINLWMADGYGTGGNNVLYQIDVTDGSIVGTYDAYPDGGVLLIAVTPDNIWGSNGNLPYLTKLTLVPAPEGCMVAWLAINEPGSLSPVTPNTWTDQSHYLHTSESITISWIARQRGTAKIPLIIAADDDYLGTAESVRRHIGSQVCLWDITETDEFEVFSGTIDDIEIKWLGKNGDRIATLTCVSLEQCFDTVRVPALLFEDQTAGDIFTALFAYAAGAPVTLGTVDVGATINEFSTADFPSIAEMFTRLAMLSQYVWGVDPGTGELYFHAPETTPSPFTLESEDVLWEQFTLKEERHDFRNRQILKPNANAAVLSKELFAGANQSDYTMLRPVQQITNGWLTFNVQNFATGTFTGQPSPGDVISFRTPTSGSGYNWSPGGTYAVGAIIIDSNGFIQKVTTSVGVTGATEPDWIEIYGQITQDNLVQWQNQGQSGFANGDLADYTFVTALDNREFGQVLIGATLAATIQNLADAINAIQDLAGVTFSLPTWENPVVNADTPAGGTTIIVRNKAAEASYITALDDTSANFSWSSPQTQGGLTTFGTQIITFGVSGQTTGGSVFTVVYTPGSNVIHSATPLPPGTSLQIEYAATNSGFIQVEDTASVIERAAIEGGTGKYQQQSSDDSIVSLPVGLQLAQQQLAAFGTIPSTFQFTTMAAGLYVGQALQIAMLSPDNAPTLINGSWFLQEIQAEVVPVYGEDGASDRWLPGGGHFRYTITCIDVAQIGSWIDFWLGLGGGSSSSASPAFSAGALGPGDAGTFGGVNEQTVDYIALSTDNGKLISMHAVGSPLVSLTLTLPAAPPSPTWGIFVENAGSTTLDIDPGALELDLVVAILTLQPDTGLYISTDGINYFTSRGIGGGSPVTAEPANYLYAGPVSGADADPTFRAAVVNDYPFHDEVLTDGASNIIYAGGDVVMVIGVPN